MRAFQNCPKFKNRMRFGFWATLLHRIWYKIIFKLNVPGRKHFSEFEQPLKTRISRSRSVFLFKFQQLSVFVILTAYTLAKDGWKHFQDTSTKVNYNAQLLLNKKWRQILFFFQRFILKYYVQGPRKRKAGGRLGRASHRIGELYIGLCHPFSTQSRFWTFLTPSRGQFYSNNKTY